GGIAVPPHCAQVEAPGGLLWLPCVQPLANSAGTSAKPSSITTAEGAGLGRGATTGAVPTARAATAAGSTGTAGRGALSVSVKVNAPVPLLPMSKLPFAE